MAKQKQKKFARGIRQRADGSYQAHKMIAGARVWSSWPTGTPESTMIAWREDQAKQPKPAAIEAPPAGSFAADIVRFEQLRAAQPTIAQFVRTLHLWAGALGRDRARNTISADEIQIVLQDWIAAGLTNASGRKYLSQLQTFFVELNGAKGANPAHNVTRPTRPKYGAPRALDYEVIEHALAHISPTRYGGRRPNLSYYRLRVMAYTGIPPGMIGQIGRGDVHRRDAYVDVPPRLKGEGIEARAIPLTEQGLEAFGDFDHVGAWGEFDVSTTNETWQSGARRGGVVDAAGAVRTHQYDLRHSFGTLMYRLTRDLATVGRFLGHAPGSPLTARYALGANRDVDQAAARLASERFAAAIAAGRPRAALALV